MDHFSTTLPFPSKPSGYKNVNNTVYSEKIKNKSKKILFN